MTLESSELDDQLPYPSIPPFPSRPTMHGLSPSRGLISFPLNLRKCYEKYWTCSRYVEKKNIKRIGGMIPLFEVRQMAFGLMQKIHFILYGILSSSLSVSWFRKHTTYLVLLDYVCGGKVFLPSLISLFRGFENICC